MALEMFRWALVGEFLNRDEELRRLDGWWRDETREPLAMLGRRRVGKSWLFRRFAHGKPAVVLVSEQLPTGVQLTRFAELLEPLVGVRPDLPDVPSLFRVLYRAARDRQILVVIDEFPWLLGTSSSVVQRTLTSIQAVMEEEHSSSRLKLVLCGSQVELMESLFGEKNPMHGRLRRMPVRPLSFGGAAPFLEGLGPFAAFERFALTGGMPMYLAKLRRGTLREAVCREILDRDAPLWNEGRAIVEQELREPRVYFAILEQLAGGAKEVNRIAQPLRMETNAVGRYLETLIGLGLVSKRDPFGAPEQSRSGRRYLDDAFLRFWFRFVFPFQSDLEAGLAPQAVFDAEVAPVIADHVAPVFEAWCLEWLRAHQAEVATRFGPWWGNALHQLRRDGTRSTEEIDAVGSRRGRVTVVAEAKWTAAKLTPAIVSDLDRFKIPALRQSGLRVVDRLRIVLFAKAGYSEALRRMAEEDDRLVLVDVASELSRQMGE